MKKGLCKVFAFMLSLTLAMTLAGCGSSQSTDTSTSDSTSSSSTEPEYTFKMSGTVAEDHLVTKTDRFFCDTVEELSNGRIHIELYPNNQLGDPRSMLEATSMGNNDFVECGMPMYANFTNQLKFFNLPFLWDNRDAAYAFLTETDQGKEIRAAVEEEVGVRILGLIDNGFFTWTSNKEMKTPEDVKGFKLRCQESDVLLQIWNDLGASPLPMAFTEVYTALQQGAIDGQMNGYITNYNNGYYEVQEYTNVAGLLFDACPLSVSADVYYSLPEDLQAVLDEAGRMTQEWCKEQAREENLRCREGCIEKGMKMNDMMDEASRSVWKEASQPTYEWFRESFPEIDLDAILETVNELNTKFASSNADEVF